MGWVTIDRTNSDVSSKLIAPSSTLAALIKALSTAAAVSSSALCSATVRIDGKWFVSEQHDGQSEDWEGKKDVR
jgi:hypothetical protein